MYDALNVLMAMNIISKEKKEIRWLGLPPNSIQECTALEKEKQSKIERIQEKSQQLQELIVRVRLFKTLYLNYHKYCGPIKSYMLKILY